MEPLNKAVALRMETCSSRMCNLQEGAQNIPDGGHELCSMVRVYLNWNLKSQDPTRDESPGTISCRDRG